MIHSAVLNDLREVRVEVGQGGPGEGETIVDQRYYTLDKNCFFAFNADRDRFAEILIDTLRPRS